MGLTKKKEIQEIIEYSHSSIANVIKLANRKHKTYKSDIFGAIAYKHFLSLCQANKDQCITSDTRDHTGGQPW